MLFFIITLSLTKLKEYECHIQVIGVINSWKHSNFLCQTYVKNGLVDILYNVYSEKKTSKEL